MRIPPIFPWPCLPLFLCSPYGLVYMPVSPRLNCTTEKCGWKQVLTDGIRPRSDVSETSKLEATEAVVLLGITPPEMKYFSFTPYLYGRHYPAGYVPSTATQAISRCPVGPAYCKIFARYVTYMCGSFVGVAWIDISDMPLIVHPTCIVVALPIL